MFSHKLIRSFLCCGLRERTLVTGREGCVCSGGGVQIMTGRQPRKHLLPPYWLPVYTPLYHDQQNHDHQKLIFTICNPNNNAP